MRIRYGPWSGRQDPFGTDVSPDAVLDDIAEDLLAGSHADEALRGLLRRGLSTRAGGRMPGLDDLRRRVEQARRREQARMGVDGPLRRIEQRLAEIVATERTALELADDPAATTDRSAVLDALPADVAARLSALSDYDWHDDRAARDYAELVEQLRRDVAAATFGRLAAGMGSARPEDVARTGAMLGELNALIDRRERGEEVDADYDAFRARYADLLPDEGRQGLDALLAEIAARMAALSRMIAGLDADQRRQLGEMAEHLLGDIDLGFQADQLRRHLQTLSPQLDWNQPVPGAQAGGRSAEGLSRTVDWVEHLQSHDDLAAALEQDYPGAALEDIDGDEVRRLLGEQAEEDLRALKAVERALEEAGAASRRHGRLELTPRGIRRLGERSLARIYERAVTGPVGSHRAAGAGGDGELTGSTRPLQFGDPFRVDVTRSLSNAIRRQGPRPRRGAGLRLQADDFELAEAERRVRASTVLLLDMSFSMPLRGNWIPAKRVALALHSLIDGRFPDDRFWVVGFSDYARQLRPRDLLDTGWERVYGTNMQHAFQVARRLLNSAPASEQQVILVTDGEPTAHLEGGVASFAWPPERRTLELTLREAARLARTGATLNVFLLDHDPGAAVFIERMVGAYGGRIFYPDLDDLGSLVMRDFLRRRA